MSELVRPGIQKVLNSYHQRAPSSLKGPGLMHSHKQELKSHEFCDPQSLPPPPLLPHTIQEPAPALPHPIFSTPDHSCGILYRTELEGHLIGCFLVGGEMRLCFPQVLNQVLKECSFNEIHRVIDYLGIDCSPCTPEQLHEFKAAEILPKETKSCGLITRTNAERLCSILLHNSEFTRNTEGLVSFMVFTNCFDKCQGICTPDLYSFKDPACIQCVRCNGWFSPQRFVCHAHKKPETYTCHWGFNSKNWRSYIQVEYEHENREQFNKLLDKLKDREQREQQFRDLEQRKRKASLEDSMLNYIKSEGIDIPAKKIKVDDYHHIPDFHQQFMVLRHQPIPFMPFMPMPPSQPSKLSLAYTNPSLFNDQFTEPPILQNPERVIRLSESQKFESDFQPNVALAPRKKDINITSHMPTSPMNQIVLVGAVVKQEQLEIKEEPPCTPPEIQQEVYSLPNCRAICNHTPVNSEASQSGSNEITSSTSPVPVASNSHRDRSSLINNNADNKKNYEENSPLNRLSPNPNENTDDKHQIVQIANTDISNNVTVSAIGMGELELSTDTDDESVLGEADSSSKTWPIDEILKELKPDSREKLIHYLRSEKEEKKKSQEENTSLKRELSKSNNQREQLLQAYETLQKQLVYYENLHKKVDAPVIAVSSSDTNTSESGHDKNINDQKNILETQKKVSEIIVKPLKKSHRRSPEDTLVIMQQNRDEIKHVANSELISGVN